MDSARYATLPCSSCVLAALYSRSLECRRAAAAVVVMQVNVSRVSVWPPAQRCPMM